MAILYSIEITNEADFMQSYASCFFERSLFIKTKYPAALCSNVQVEFRRQNQVVSQVVGVVLYHSPYRQTAKTFGMLLELTQLDEKAEQAALLGESNAVENPRVLSLRPESANTLKKLETMQIDCNIPMVPPILSIDLFSDSAVVAHWHDDGPALLEEPAKFNLTLLEHGQKADLSGIFRFLGRYYYAAHLQNLLHFLNYPSCCDSNQLMAILSDKKIIGLKKILSDFFKLIKETSEKCLQSEVCYAVVLVPSFYDDYACQIVRQAGSEARLWVVRLQTRAIAACLQKKLTVAEQRLVMVVEFNMEYCETTLIKMQSGRFEIVATGCSILGGYRLWRERLELFLEALVYDEPYLEDFIAHSNQLTEIAKQLQEKLNGRNEAEFSLPKNVQSILAGAWLKLTRSEYELLVEDCMLLLEQLWERTLLDAEVPKEKVASVLPIGEFQNNYYFRNRLQSFFPPTTTVMGDVDNGLCALGGAMMAEALQSNRLQRRQVSANCLDFPLQLLSRHGQHSQVLLPEGTPLPYYAQTLVNILDGDFSSSSLKLIFVYGNQIPALNNSVVGILSLGYGSDPTESHGSRAVRLSLFVDISGVMVVSAGTNPVELDEPFTGIFNFF